MLVIKAPQGNVWLSVAYSSLSAFVISSMSARQVVTPVLLRVDTQRDLSREQHDAAGVPLNSLARGETEMAWDPRLRIHSPSL